MRAIAVLACITGGILAGCGDSVAPDGGQSDANLQVTTIVKPPAALPGDTLVATVLAVPASGLTIEKLFLASTGLLVRSESLAAGGTGAQTATWSFVVPFTPDSGTIVFTGGARAGSARSNGVTSVSVRDSVPPTLLN